MWKDKDAGNKTPQMSENVTNVQFLKVELNSNKSISLYISQGHTVQHVQWSNSK